MVNIKYYLSFPNRLTHFIHITIEINNIDSKELELTLPNWRPGRYELTNYVSNVKNLRAYTPLGTPVDFGKTSNNTWWLNTEGQESISIEYQYYANKMDAGSSLVDEEQIYINFINCIIYSPERISEPLTVCIDIPKNYDSICSLNCVNTNVLIADNYYDLVDSPFLASGSLKKLTYESHGKEFNIIIHGDCPLEDHDLVRDFEKFTGAQLDQMKGFPCEKFDFIIQSLPYKHYHGVEHRNSTVLVLGPGSKENRKQYYLDLMGVASHELFHVWNVTRIRPKELSPYDFSKENYYETGFVTEGFTTYYGDLFLARGGVFNEQQYLNELNIIFKRHFENYGRHHLSLVDSSYDLWIDGYKKLLPGRKVSIYVKGASVAFLLDLSIRKASSNKFGLDNIITELWQQYGKTEIGYTKSDVYDLIRKYLGENSEHFISNFYEGTTPIENELSKAVEYIGCSLVEVNHPEKTASLFGFRTEDISGSIRIIEIAPGSIAETKLSIGDVLININGTPATTNSLQDIEEKVSLEVKRNSTRKVIELKRSDTKYYHLFEIRKKESDDEVARRNYELWITGK